MKEPVPRLKVYHSERLPHRRAPVVDYPLKPKEKVPSVESVTHKSSSRSGSQKKRKASSSDLMPKRRLSSSEPKFQRRISLTEFPGTRKISPNGSPPYKKLNPYDSNEQTKHRRRSRLSKAMTLTDDSSYHHSESLSDLSPQYHFRKSSSKDKSSGGVADGDCTFSSESLSPNYTPKYVSAEAVTPAKTPPYASRESLHSFQEKIIQQTTMPRSRRTSPKKKSPLPSPAEQVKLVKDKLASLQKSQPSETLPLLAKKKSASERPPHIYRQYSQPVERETQGSHLKVIPLMPPTLISPSALDRLGPIESLPQLIRRASIKPTPVDTSSLIPLLTASQDKTLAPPTSLARQPSSLFPSPTEQISPVGYSPKPRESRRYERLK